jgi:hypothetical protein
VSAPLQIQDRIGHAVTRKGCVDPASGQSVGVIRGPQNTRLAIQILVNLAFIKAMVPARENIQPESEQFFGNQRSNAKATSAVLGVCNGQIDVVLADQFTEMFGDDPSATRGEDIADKEDVHSTGMARRKRFLRELPA